MADVILAVNTGSSSIKISLFAQEAAGRLAPSLHGEIAGLGTAPRFTLRDVAGTVLDERSWSAGGVGHEDFFAEILPSIDRALAQDRLVAAGHRIVHGGSRLSMPVRVDDPLLHELEALTPLAPLHQPQSLGALRAIKALRPDLPQVACFDTAFHHSQAPVARRFALPRELTESGILRYGFHGLSYEYVASRLGELAPPLARGKIVVAHLGNGASLCALERGQSVDTTMSFTALDGLPMGTRCGALDPGVILYLLQARQLSVDAVQDLLYHRSGLLGVSGISSDVRTLLASDHPHAREAIELFVFRIARETGALAATLGGLDGFVFTAGIGEHAAEIRQRVCDRLGWLGLRLDDDANRRHGPRINAPDSRAAVWVVPTNEEMMIARHTRALLATGVERPLPP
jgi:acetate kinase